MRLLLALAAAITLTAVSQVQAEVKLPPLIGSHMVLQREMPVPIWGTAAANEKVTVEFRGKSYEAQADKDGKWMVKIGPLTAGGPDQLTVKGSNTVTLEDVLVGEVWVGSGQSNMGGTVANYAKGDEVLAALAKKNYPKLRYAGGNGKGPWREATEANNPGFSAILFAFGVRLQEGIDVPVGLLFGAVGGTPSGYWLSEKAYREDSACQALASKLMANYSPEADQKRYEALKAQYDKAAAEAKAAGKPVGRAPELVKKPGECYGVIGNLYESQIRGFQPYAIRGVLWDQGESGTRIEGIDQYTLMGALIRGWRNEWGQGDFPFIFVQKPSGGGPAYDQTNPTTAKQDAFTPLPAVVPTDGGYRETHIRIMNYPQTAMAISSDLGPGVHPTNKSGYGQRASQVALGLVYKQPVEIYGPVYKSHKVDGNKVRVAFDHVGKGLAFKQGDKLQGFAVAGEDKKFVWAKAEIDGDEVVLTADEVKEPKAVRYAYASRHPWANLFNKDGLPAIPFRTDAW